jgi:hypothetical protein
MKSSGLCREPSRSSQFLGERKVGAVPTMADRKHRGHERDRPQASPKAWPSALVNGSLLPPVRLVGTDGAYVDGVLLAGNPAARRPPGATCLRYPRLLDRARSIRSDRRGALRFPGVRLAQRVSASAAPAGLGPANRSGSAGTAERPMRGGIFLGRSTSVASRYEVDKCVPRL